jgi:hypothetical protein
MVKVIVKDIRNRIINNNLFDELSGEGKVFSMMQDEVDDEETTKVIPKYQKKGQDTIFNYIKNREINPNQKLSRKLKEKVELIEKVPELEKIMDSLAVNEAFINRLMNTGQRLGLDIYDENSFRPYLEEQLLRTANRIYENRQLGLGRQQGQGPKKELKIPKSKNIIDELRKSETNVNQTRRKLINIMTEKANVGWTNYLRPYIENILRINNDIRDEVSDLITRQLDPSDPIIQRASQRIRLQQEQLLDIQNKLGKLRDDLLNNNPDIGVLLERGEIEIIPEVDDYLTEILTDFNDNMEQIEQDYPDVENALAGEGILFSKNKVVPDLDETGRPYKPYVPNALNAMRFYGLTDEEKQQQDIKYKNNLIRKIINSRSYDRRKNQGIRSKLKKMTIEKLEEIEKNEGILPNEIEGEGIMDFAGKVFDKFAPKKIKDKVFDVFIGNRLKAFKENIAKENQKNQYLNRM